MNIVRSFENPFKFGIFEVYGVETLSSKSFFCPLNTLFFDCYETPIVSPSCCPHPALELQFLFLRRKETDTSYLAWWNLTNDLLLLVLWRLLIFFYSWRQNASHYVLPQIL